VGGRPPALPGGPQGSGGAPAGDEVSDSHWHRRLSELDERPASEGSPYWLGPFQNYKTFCPYLVGSYRRVAEELAGYIRRGFRTFVLDIPPSKEELEHIGVVFREALETARP
jgi:alkanesulfonate monooxygenase